MKKAIAIIVFGLLLSNCASYNEGYNEAKKRAEEKRKTVSAKTYDKYLAKINNSRLFLLELGMNKSQVLEIMGVINAKDKMNPLSISVFKSKENNITVISYFTYHEGTSNWPNSFLEKENITPLVLLDGKLIGWGHEALERASEQYDLKIKKDLNIKIE